MSAEAHAIGPVEDNDFDEQAYYVERFDSIRLNALGMASAYAAHMEGGQEPEEVVRRADAYLDFLLGGHGGSIQ